MNFLFPQWTVGGSIKTITLEKSYSILTNFIVWKQQLRIKATVVKIYTVYILKCSEGLSSFKAAKPHSIHLLKNQLLMRMIHFIETASIIPSYPKPLLNNKNLEQGSVGGSKLYCRTNIHDRKQQNHYI